MRLNDISIKWKLLIFSGGSLLVMVALLGYFGISAANSSTRQTLDERLALAEQVARGVDYNIEQTFLQLRSISPNDLVGINEEGPSPTQFLKELKRILPFNIQYVAVIDGSGIVLATEPSITQLIGSEVTLDSAVRSSISAQIPFVSNSIYDNYVQDYVSYIIAPLNRPDPGSPAMTFMAAIKLSSNSIGHFISLSGPEKTGYLEVVDGNGMVLASSVPENLLKMSDHGGMFGKLIQQRQTVVSTCHNCHTQSENASRTNEIITFAPLTAATWGVVIRQSEQEALAHTRDLQQKLLIFSLIAFGIMLPTAWMLSRNITGSLYRLTLASRKIAAGSLDESVHIQGKDEIGVLASSFETMRLKLKDSIERTRQRTTELEGLNSKQNAMAIENAKLYENLRNKEIILTELLEKSISAQEDERKRIARELHDETSQALTTLAIKLETLAKSPLPGEQQLKAACRENQMLISRILNDVHRLILDLRPSVLDDLGLIPALGWYAEHRLGHEGVKTHLETSGEEKRLPSHIEVSLFRIAQEAISNIAQHAHAEYASITLDFDPKTIKLTVEDDGNGFETTLQLSGKLDKHGLGLLGMSERAQLLGGNLTIKSYPGKGTQISIAIPVSWK